MTTRTQWLNIPERRSLDDYESAIAAFADAVARPEHPQVKSIWRFGEISSPGISDIDVAVVLSGSPTAEERLALGSWRALQPLFVHGPLLIPEELFSRISTFLTYRFDSVGRFQRTAAAHSSLEDMRSAIAYSNGKLINARLVREATGRNGWLLANQLDARFFLLFARSLKRSVIGLRGLLQELGHESSQPNDFLVKEVAVREANDQAKPITAQLLNELRSAMPAAISYIENAQVRAESVLVGQVAQRAALHAVGRQLNLLADDYVAFYSESMAREYGGMIPTALSELRPDSIMRRLLNRMGREVILAGQFIRRPHAR